MQPNQVIDVLSCRLKIGGQWFGRGDPVQLNEEDARVYRSRGLSSPAPAGTVAKNVKTLPASAVGLVTKDEVPKEKEEKSVYSEESAIKHGGIVQLQKGNRDGRRSR
jgi:hypothetical protein